MPDYKEKGIVYDGFTEENLAAFKKEWETYKNSLVARLEAFRKDAEEKNALLKTSYEDIINKLKRLGY